MTDIPNREAQPDPEAPGNTEAPADPDTLTVRHASADAKALADLDALAQLTGLQIPAQYREGVATQFAGLMAQAQLLLGAPLPDELEPAPVFTP